MRLTMIELEMLNICDMIRGVPIEDMLSENRLS